MFTDLKELYGLDNIDYEAKAVVIKKDIEYLNLHYYRTRINDKFDILIVLPSLLGDPKNRLLQDMYLNSIGSWKDNLENILEALDVLDAVVSDITLLTTGPREQSVPRLKLLNVELKLLANLNFGSYLDDIFENDTDLINEVKDLLKT